MTVPDHPHAQDWMAAGIQHAVLMRTLPAVRHDLAGPLSVMRMGVTVLKLRLAPGADTTPAQTLERIEQLESHLGTLGEQVRRLRHWDLQINERQPAHATLHEAMELARPLLSLRGIALPPLPDAGKAQHSAAPHHPLLYLALAALYHLGELPGEPPQEIAIEASHTTLRFHARGTVAPDALPPLVPPGAGQSTPPIDAEALHCLARSLGLNVRTAARSVEIDLSQA